LQRGSPLAQLLREQASSARAEIEIQLLKKSGRNETKMMVPLVFLILPVTVLFAVYPSLQLLNLNYF
jgi:tight adherence protein C